MYFEVRADLAVERNTGDHAGGRLGAHQVQSDHIWQAENTA